MLEVKNLKKIYKTKNGADVNALDGISLSFPEKGMVFLLGKSGSGKSTLLNVCGGLDSPSEGEIIVKGRSSKDFSQGDFDSYRNTFIGFIFQEYNILNEFSVEDNIALALELQGKHKDKAAIASLLDEVDLTGFAKRKPNTLSGGQKQRIAIARALIKAPEIIMADEPTGALDSNTGKQVFDTLKKLSKNKLVIVVSHDRDFAEQYGDRIIELMDGKVLSDVSKTQVQQESISDNINSVGDVLLCKRGSDLTDSDFDKIKTFLKNSSQDIIIANSEKDVTAFKKISRINDDGAKEVFSKTKEVTTKTYSPKDSQFIRSKLPMKHAFKIGISSLRSKPFRLCITSLLCVVAFVLFGLLSTLSFYNSHDTFVQTMADGGVSAMSLVKKYKGSITMYSNGKEDYGHEVYMNTTFTKDELDDVISTLGEDAFGGVEYSTTFNLRQNDSSYYNGSVSSFAFLPEGNSIRNTITGNYPKEKNEIAVSSYLAETLVNCKVYDSEGTSLELSSTDQLIGKKINLSNYTYKITGIVDSGIIPEEYIALKENALGNESLTAKFNAFLADGIHQFVFVTSERIFELESETPDYTEGLHNYTYITTALSNNGQFNIPEYSTSNYITSSMKDSSKIFAITSNKEVPEKNEAIISSIMFSRMVSDLYYELAQDCGENFELMDKYYAVADLANQVGMGGKYNYDQETGKDNFTAFSEKELSDNITKLISSLKNDNIDLTIGAKIFDHHSNSALGELTKFKLTGVYLDKNFQYATGSLVVSDEDFELLWNEQKTTVDYYSVLESKYTEPENAIYDRIVIPFTYSPETAEMYWGIYNNSDLNDDDSISQLAGSFVETLQMIDETVKQMSQIFLYVGIVLAIFAALLLSNFISASISQKKREIGILRAVGARSTDVFKIFFSESFIIGVICITLSTVASMILCNVINEQLAVGLGASLFVFGIPSFIVLVAVALVTIIAATFIPVNNAARKKPVDSIRSL